MVEKVMKPKERRSPLCLELFEAVYSNISKSLIQGKVKEDTVVEISSHKVCFAGFILNLEDVFF